MNWNKTNTQKYVSKCGCYIIAGRYTYYQGWTAYYIPDGERGEWVRLDGQYAGKGALATCKAICEDHKAIAVFKAICEDHKTR